MGNAFAYEDVKTQKHFQNIFHLAGAEDLVCQDAVRSGDVSKDQPVQSPLSQNIWQNDVLPETKFRKMLPSTITWFCAAKMWDTKNI